MWTIAKGVAPIILALLWGTFYSSVQAQEEQPFIKLIDVDVSQYPTTTASLSGSGLAVDNPRSVTISETVEGGVITHVVTLSEPKVVGVQLAIIIDPQGMEQISIDGSKSRCAVLKDVMGQLIKEDSQKDILENSYDRMALYTFDTASQTAINIRDRGLGETWKWTVEPKSVSSNGVGRYCDMTQTTAVASDVLTPLLTAVLDKFTGVVDTPEGANPKLTKEVLLFSAGTSTFDPTGLAQRARQLGVYIHVVELPGQGFSGSNGLLQQLAVQTQATHVVLDSLEKLPALWERIRIDRQQREVTYQATSILVKEIAVRATLLKGMDIFDSTTNRGIDISQKISALGLQPPLLALVQPADGETIKWETLDGVGELKSEVMPVKLMITPGTGAIGIKEVRYRLTSSDGLSIEQLRTEAPFEEASFVMTQAVIGDYTLTITATDLVGQTAQPITAQIRFERKATPTPISDSIDAVRPGAITAGNVLSSATSTQGDVAKTGVEAPIEQASDQGDSSMNWKYFSLIAIVLAILGYLLFLLVIWLVGRGRARKVQSGQVAPDSIYSLAKTDDRIHNREESTAGWSVSDAEKLSDEEGDEEIRSYRGRRSEEARKRQASPWASRDEMTLEDEDEATQRSMPLQQRIFAHLVRLDKAMGDLCGEKSHLKLPSMIDVPDVVNHIYLGRSEGKNQLLIDDERISRQQARFIKVKGHFYIEDMVNSAGTYVNTVRLEAEKPKLLHHGDQINFGEVAYEYRVQREARTVEELEEEKTD